MITWLTKAYVQFLFKIVLFDEAFDFVGRKVTESSSSPPIFFQNFNKYIGFCIKNNNFKWSGSAYKQIHVISVGNIAPTGYNRPIYGTLGN